ncbi:MAG: hypothetical protein HY053_01715 [Proteobacteria bacterium]|nr:hypothetical protein [Pseudomonadota bacterium]
MTIGERTFVVGTLPPDHSDGTGLVLASMTVRGGGTLARKSKLDGSRIG